MALGGGDEVVPDHLPNAMEFVVGQPAAITGELLGLLELQLDAALAGLTFEIAQEVVGTLERLDAAGGDVVLRLPFHRLPPFSPEPRLVGTVRKLRMQLDHPIFPFDDFDLRTGLVEMVPAADVGRERDRTAAGREGHEMRASLRHEPRS